MYMRTDSPLHIIQEMIDNAAVEALGGHAARLDVTMHTDGSVSVRDDGRGIPVVPHPVEEAPTVEVVFTRLQREYRSAGPRSTARDGRGNLRRQDPIKAMRRVCMGRPPDTHFDPTIIHQAGDAGNKGMR